MEGNKIGITAGMDGAWQRRGSGHAYNSLTGYNYMLGGMTSLICGLQVFSKKCRVCAVARKNNTPPKEHRCPLNFDEDKSAKSTEGHGAVRHCVEIFKRTADKAQAWVHTLVTDDDASTRANVKWNLKDYYDKSLGK